MKAVTYNRKGEIVISHIHENNISETKGMDFSDEHLFSIDWYEVAKNMQPLECDSVPFTGEGKARLKSYLSECISRASILGVVV